MISGGTFVGLFVAILLKKWAECWEIDYFGVTSPVYWWASSREPTCCSCVRAPLGESLRCFCLCSSLFPKKRRGEPGPGRRAAAIIGKLAEIPLSHTQSAHELIRTRTNCVAVEAYFGRNTTAIATNSPLSRVRDRPSIMWAQQWAE